MMKPHKQLLVEGIVIALLGIVLLLLIPSQVEEMPWGTAQMSPSFFPTVAAAFLIILGGVMLYQSFLPSEAPSALDISRNAVVRVILTAVLLGAYTSLFARIGFVVTSAVFFAIFAYIFGLRNVLKIVVSMILVPVVVWLFFEVLFKIPLPHGALF
jgi:hypothetical protein